MHTSQIHSSTKKHQYREGLTGFVFFFFKPLELVKIIPWTEVFKVDESLRKQSKNTIRDRGSTAARYKLLKEGLPITIWAGGPWETRRRWKERSRSSHAICHQVVELRPMWLCGMVGGRREKGERGPATQTPEEKSFLKPTTRGWNELFDQT